MMSSSVEGLVNIGSVDDSYVNSVATRSIDILSHIVRESIQFDVSVSSSAKDNKKDYYFSLPLSWNPFIAKMKVSIDKKEYKKDSLIINNDAKNGVMFIAVPSAETSKLASFKAQIDLVLVQTLDPLPKEITQEETQSVVFSLPDDSVGIISPYIIKSQTTSVSLPNKTKIHKRSQNPKPNSVAGTIIKYGPYSEKETESALLSPLSCHFEFNGQMFVFTNMLREYEISHWGNCAVEDHYDLVHTGAKLLGGFSRGVYTRTRFDAGGPSFRSLKANLPPRASNIYYRDVIGNISTSQVKYQRAVTELEIETRFPIYGGWKTSWYQGYDVPLSTVATYDEKSGKYSLKLPFSIPFSNSHVENLKVKVVLPQFSSNVEYKSDVPTSSSSMSERHTFLDIEFFEGRPVIVLDYKNIVSPEHDSYIIVTYELNSLSLLSKPLYVSGILFICFIIYIISARFASSSSSDSKNNQSSKRKQKSL